MRQTRCCPEDSRTRSTMCSGNSPQPSRYGWLGWEGWHTTVSSCHLLHTVALFLSLIPRPSSGHDHSHRDLCYSIATVTSLCSLLHSHPLTYPHAIYNVHIRTHLPPPIHTHTTPICPTPSHPHPPTHLTQVILLSATMPMDVLDVTKRFMREPIRILVKKEELTLEGIRQFYIQVEKEVSGSAVPSLQWTLGVRGWTLSREDDD